jgi:hypothetical protein
MGIRAPALREARSDFAKRDRKTIGRIYLFWLLGVLATALNIRVTKFSAIGLEASIDHPEAIPGVLFLICILLLIGGMGTFMASTGPYEVFTPTMLERRAAIYKAVGKSHVAQVQNGYSGDQIQSSYSNWP